jgi:hypothetical protein
MITKIAHVMSTEGTERVVTQYAQGPMRRMDVRSWTGEIPRGANPSEPFRVAFIRNCETRQSFTLDLDAREYVEESTSPAPPSIRRPESQSSTEPPPAPTLAVESETTDTGEVKDFFGHTAHHFITNMKVTPIGEAALSQGASEESTDAWYIDAEVPAQDCLETHNSLGFAVTFLTAGPPGSIRPTVKHIGPVPKGIVVRMKRVTHTVQSGGGTQTVTTFKREVTELSDGALDPKLFEIPDGFRKVEHLYRH